MLLSEHYSGLKQLRHDLCLNNLISLLYDFNLILFTDTTKLMFADLKKKKQTEPY